MNTTPNTLNNPESVESTPQTDEGKPMENNVRIEKILTLKNFGIFQDFSWKDELPIFKKFNLIYGSNRSGKTTISRIFASCEKKTTNNFNQYPENGEFKIQTSDGNPLNNTNVAESTLLIRVFNQEFIDENVSFDPSDSCNPIVYVDKENIEDQKKLKELETYEIELEKDYKHAEKNHSQKEGKKGNFLYLLGRQIEDIRNGRYDRKQVQDRIDLHGIEYFNDKVLLEEEREKYESIRTSKSGKQQSGLPSYHIAFSFDGRNINSFQEIFEETEKLLKKRVIMEVLGRLENDKDLNNWVELGFNLHLSKNEKDECLFCEKPLDKDFLTNLSKHFNKEYKELQNSIGILKQSIPKQEDKVPPENHQLSPDLTDKYTGETKNLNQCIHDMNKWIEEVQKKLDEKHKNILAIVESPRVPDDFATLYNQIKDRANKIIDEHNDKIKNHDNLVNEAQKKIEDYFIASALKGIDYEEMLEDIKKSLIEQQKIVDARKENNGAMAKLKQPSNIGEAPEIINQHLREFFGRKEIELDLDGRGYKIKRNGKPAKNLSEGEKTAIAFSYFVAKIDEQGFEKQKGIVFIDDPISSFDSNFIYHCFAMIRIYFKGVEQLFISTHDFQLFNLIKEWFVYEKNEVEKDNRKAVRRNEKHILEKHILEKPILEKPILEKPIPSEFFMVESFIDEKDHRKSQIVALDETLLHYKSEYHFLFKKLKEFRDKSNTEYQDLYTIGNVARRFFEIFTDFKIPSRSKPKDKLNELIKNTSVTQVVADKAYKVFNELSHNFYPMSANRHIRNDEVKSAIEILLTLVKESDLKHYEALEKSSNS